MSRSINDPNASQSAANMTEETLAQKIQEPGKAVPLSASQPIPAKDLGIKVRTQPDNEDDIDIDILAVPGIGADPETTWTYIERDPQDKSKITREVNWLSDSTMLPRTFHNARIMTFGYDSRWFGDAPPKQRLSGIARKVLAELKRKRKDCERRPILFIGHCYGGLVMQQVYLQSKEFPSDYPGIYNSITGMVFLGTPHYGSDMLGNLGDIYETIRKQCLQIETGLLKTIDHDNTVLVDIVANFTREVKLRIAGPEIFCFFEERATALGRIANLKDHPLVFVVNESSGSLPGYEKLGLTVDHFNMNKFGSSEDNHYVSVVEVMQKMREKSEDLMKQRRAATHGHTSDNRSQQTDSEAHKSIPMLPFSVAKGFSPRNGILDKIKSHFDHSESSKVVLVGGCGSGKTHVAVEYADSFHRENPEAMIYCVNASNAAEFELSYHTIKTKLNLKTGKNGNVMRTVRDHLNQGECGQWLMIIDGLDLDKSTNEKDKQTATAYGKDPDSQKSILDYIPDGHIYTSQVLVTTRSKRVAKRVTDHKYVVELPNRLTTEDALKLLLPGSKSKSSSPISYQQKIAEALQGSAGALALVRAYKETSGSEFSWKALWGLIQTSIKDNYEVQRQIDEQIRPMLGIWKPLYAHLKDNHSDAAELLHLLCRLDVQSMPVLLIDNHFDDKSKGGEQKKVLRKHDMLELSVNKRDARVTPMIRLLANAMVDNKPDDAIWLDEAALELVSNTFPSPEKANNITCRALEPCAFAALQLQFESPKAHRQKAQLLLNLGAYERRAGNHDSATKLLEECVVLCKSRGMRSEDARTFGKAAKKLLDNAQKDRLKAPRRHSTEMDGSESDSHLVEFPGTRSVEALGSEIISISPESKADDVRNMSHAVLGAHRRAGCMEDNIKRHRQILGWYQAKFGARHQDTVRQQFNLALALDANGERAEAEKIYLEAIKAMESIYGKGSSPNPDLLRIQASLARNYCEQKRFKEAEDIFTKVLEDQTETLGLDHPETLVTRMNLALLAQELRPEDLETPAAELHSVVAAQRRLLGTTHPATLVTACNLAQNFRLRGRILDAEPLFKMCLEEQMANLGETHLDTMRTLAIRKELENTTEVY